MGQKNCHARSKQKRRKLLLKLRNFWSRVVTKRAEKIKISQAPKGRTIKLKHEQDRMSNYAVPYTDLFPNGDGGRWMFDTHHARNLNQRQKRKRASGGRSINRKKKSGLRKAA